LVYDFCIDLKKIFELLEAYGVGRDDTLGYGECRSGFGLNDEIEFGENRL
jgi:hypothetical protein